MGFGRLPVVLLLYVAVDFANPLMPGAVSFTDGSIEIVHAERARVGDLPGQVPRAPALDGGDPVGRSWRPPHPIPIRVAARRWLVPVRRGVPTRPDPPPPIEDR
jgi:hypothetical protein